ncbi:chitinase-3-like protein 1 [Biomphalaria pfeifferi]|uniref:Chitinase-3-like protein 1 n=1 Tax=Biomphalaria pfeifferi TaxID=112525 RepID=A0AAD8ATR5_BIOPF|nr:chitinase-3-like protein 1 [Biomphalaria pfeifferi]
MLPKIVEIIFLLYILNDFTCGFMRVCYFPSWAFERSSTLARFDVANVDPYICTHIIYAFGKIDGSNTNLQTPSDEKRYMLFTDLKKQNFQLRTLLSIGGENDHGEGFVSVSQNNSQTGVFASRAVAFLRKYNFDGLDIDWEFPNINTSENFVRILKSLRQAFDQDTTSPRLLLTIAAPAGSSNMRGFNITEINKYVDYVSLMTYDFVDARYSEVTNFNSPLYSRNSSAFNQEFSTNWTVHEYEKLGLHLNKTLIGVSGTAKWLYLNNSENSIPGSPIVKGFLKNSTAYGITGGLAYPEVCQYIRDNNGTKIVFDEQQRARYLVNGRDWITYDDPEVIKNKTDWAVRIGVAGIMLWSLDQDDFNGTMCQQGTFPLLSQIISSTEGNRTTLPTTTTTTTTKATTTTTKATTTTIKESTFTSNTGCLPATLNLTFVIPTRLNCDLVLQVARSLFFLFSHPSRMSFPCFIFFLMTASFAMGDSLLPVQTQRDTSEVIGAFMRNLKKDISMSEVYGYASDLIAELYEIDKYSQVFFSDIFDARSLAAATSMDLSNKLNNQVFILEQLSARYNVLLKSKDDDQINSLVLPSMYDVILKIASLSRVILRKFPTDSQVMTTTDSTMFDPLRRDPRQLPIICSIVCFRNDLRCCWRGRK